MIAGFTVYDEKAMLFSTTELAAEHREIEAALETLAAGHVDADTVRGVRSLCARHYLREEEFLATLHAAAAAKLKTQHAEALELAGRLEESLGTADAAYLSRRLVAIVQHNIIEEERDVFPLAARP